MAQPLRDANRPLDGNTWAPQRLLSEFPHFKNTLAALNMAATSHTQRWAEEWVFFASALYLEETVRLSVKRWGTNLQEGHLVCVEVSDLSFNKAYIISSHCWRALAPCWATHTHTQFTFSLQLSWGHISSWNLISLHSADAILGGCGCAHTTP